MKQMGLALMIVTCLGFFPSGVSGEDAASGGRVYVCMDPAHPYIGDLAGACPLCKKDLTEKSLPVEALMESLAVFTKAMNADVSAGKTDSLKQHAEGIVFISDKLAGIAPAKKPEKQSEFKKLAGELAEKANAILVAADAKDEAGMKAGYKNLESLCKSCHSVFR